MDNIKKNIERYINNQEYTKALEELTNYILNNKKDVELYILRGDIYYKKQEYGKALNDFNLVINLQPDNKIIKSRVEMIKDILKFQALDIYSSTNLNKDPWLDD
ncbi:MAG: tetratricopeptide repeat protein [Bacteroidetes bacterium]|nr:tetratricopeptide repeat protein [Bacteroidota bacterium]